MTKQKCQRCKKETDVLYQPFHKATLPENLGIVKNYQTVDRINDLCKKCVDFGYGPEDQYTPHD